MLLKTKTFPDYITEKTKQEIIEKWFSVYNYISLKELIWTARKDYLYILDKINIVFWIIVIALWVISFYINNFLILFWFIFIVYFIIFWIVFVKLLLKTRLYLYISDVVYTKKWLIISDDFLYYKKDEDKINQKILKYWSVFDEYLWKSSRLEELITKKKNEVLENTFNTGFSIIKSLLEWKRSEKSWWVVLVIAFSILLYIAFIYIFYYIWYFFSFIFSRIYVFILKIIVNLKNKIELKIKQKTLKIDEKIKKMKFIYSNLKNKLDEFKEWQISNIWNFVEENFSNFYTQIEIILNETKKLKLLIENSKYNGFIDFNHFKKYLKKNFNKPVLDMISLLMVYKKLLQKEIFNLEKLNRNSQRQKLDINNTEILDENLKQKEFILKQKLSILNSNIEKLKNSLL